ncbi:MAG: transcription initiation factor IIB family protein [Halanaeroarchaeum sp.]
MYRAGDEVEHREWLAELQSIADRLDLDTAARSTAQELFLSDIPDEERSKRASLAASVYAGALIAGDQRSQIAVADAADVSRLVIQRRWKNLVEAAGLRSPDW